MIDSPTRLDGNHRRCLPVLADDSQKLFHLLRDSLQIPDVYFAFVGYTGFYKQIIHPIERVRSIFFNLPIYLPPLSEAQILELIERRYRLLAKGNYITPVEENFISYLYQLYNGKIRSILDTLSTLIANVSFPTEHTLSQNEAKAILASSLQERLSSVLSEKAFFVLTKIAKEGECTIAGIAHKVKQARQNIALYFKKLEEFKYIELFK